MQFPNNVNKSNLVKLGMLGAAMYFMNNRNKSKASITDNSGNQQQQQLDKNQEKLDSQEKMTPLMFGKSLADKWLGKKR